MSSLFQTGFFETQVLFIAPANPVIFSYLYVVNKCTYFHFSESLDAVSKIGGKRMLIQTPLPHDDMK